MQQQRLSLIRELTFLLTSNPQHLLMQKLLKPMINSVNPKYIQHLDQCLLWLSEYLQLNSRNNLVLA